MNRSLAATARLTTVLTCALWAATGFAALGEHGWLFELSTHFKLQYAALFALCLFVLVAARRWMPAVLAAAGVLLQGGTFMTVAAAEHGLDARGDGPRLRVLSFNLWSGATALEHAPAYFAASGADVVVVQQLETEWIGPLAAALPDYPHVFDGAGAERHGVVVFSRWPLVDTAAYGLAPGGARAARVRIDLGGQTVTIISTHLHWPLVPNLAELRNTEARSLGDVTAAETGPLVVVGDLNMSRWSPHFESLLERGKLRPCANGALLPTWPAPLGLAGIGIDHCLMRGAVSAVAVRTGPFLWSDHYPLIADLELGATGVH